MGNDGGSIPDRRDLVKTKPKVRSPHRLANSDTDLRKSRPNKPTKQTRRELAGSFAHCQRYVFFLSHSFADILNLQSLSVNYKNPLYHVPSGNSTTKTPS